MTDPFMLDGRATAFALLSLVVRIGVLTNTDLTVYLHRSAVGEWVCLQAWTTVDGAGGGLAESVIHDRDGPVARGLQSLFVDERD